MAFVQDHFFKVICYRRLLYYWFYWSVIFSLDVIPIPEQIFSRVLSETAPLYVILFAFSNPLLAEPSVVKASTFYKLSWKRWNVRNGILFSKNCFLSLTGLRHVKNLLYVQCFMHCTLHLCRPSLQSNWAKHICRLQSGVALTLLASKP